MKFKIKFLILTVLMALAIPAFAEVPRVINYQGRLTDASGNAINGSKPVIFRIYDVETAGNALWAEDHTIIAQKGVFSVLLGSVTPLNIAFDKQYYIEIVVDGVELSPRMAIASSAYAINANSVNGIELSVNPEAGKAVAMNENSKLPFSAFKVYDSGWFPITKNSNYVKYHNLGTRKVLTSVYFTSDPTNEYDCRTITTGIGPTGKEFGLQLSTWDSEKFTVSTWKDGCWYAKGYIPTYNGLGDESGFCRVIMLALE